VVQATGCTTCPYLRSTPPGIWAPSEYKRLADYDEVPAKACARKACDNLAMHPHRDLPGLYCTPCAHRINRENGAELVNTGVMRCGPKLPEALSTFMCHQTSASGVDTICRGWLSVHRDSIGVRATCATGQIDVSDVPTEPEPEYYSSGTEARDAGLAAIKAPCEKAKLQSRKLVRRGAGRWEDDAMKEDYEDQEEE
jgi:hypothetical protein